MSLLNETDAQYLDDTRTLHIAEVSGETPEAVVEFAEELSTRDGVSVDEELTDGDDMASIEEALSDDEDEDEDEDDLTGWSESDDIDL